MRVLADSNIVAQAVRAMRDAGHDVVYAGERTVDPGDQVLLDEAAANGRAFVTKDHDIGALVHRDRRSPAATIQKVVVCSERRSISNSPSCCVRTSFGEHLRRLRYFRA